MLRYLAIILFILTYLGVRWLQRRLGSAPDGGLSRFWQALREDATALRRNKTGNNTGLGLRITFRLGLICFALLAISGFLPLILIGQHLSGWLLMLHLLAAPVFVICLVVLALFGSHRLRLNHTDLDSLQQKPEMGTGLLSRRMVKFTYWAVLLLSLPLLLSVGLSMYPYFGTGGQQQMLLLHGYSALLLTVTVVFLIFFLQRAPEWGNSPPGDEE